MGTAVRLIAAHPMWGARQTGCGLLSFAACLLSCPGPAKVRGERSWRRWGWGWAPKRLFLLPGLQALGAAPFLSACCCPSLRAPFGFWLQWVVHWRDTVATPSFMPFLLVYWLIKRGKPTASNRMEFIKSGRVVNNLMFAFSE